jgi:hypothetical protein
MHYPVLAARHYSDPRPYHITFAGGRYFVSLINIHSQTLARSFSIVSLGEEGTYRGLLDIHSGSYAYTSIQALNLPGGDLISAFGTFSQSGKTVPYTRRFSDKQKLKLGGKPTQIPFDEEASAITLGQLDNGRLVMVVNKSASVFQIYLLDAKGKIQANGGLRTPETYFFYNIAVVPHADSNHLLLPAVAEFPGEKPGIYLFTENIPQ